MSSGIPSSKLIVVGSSGSGKTTIIQRFIMDTFRHESQATVGVEFKTYVCSINGKEVKLQIWDTAGQERFRSVAKSYFRNAVGAILVFTVTDRSTFTEAAQWLNDIHSLSHPNSVVLLVGNQIDQQDKRVVSESEALSFAKRHGLYYIETSALSGKNISEAFMHVAHEIHNKISAGNLILPTLVLQPPMIYTDPIQNQNDNINNKCNC